MDMPDPDLRAMDFAVVDLETTGGRAVAAWDREGRFQPACEITEVGVVTLHGQVCQDTYASLCAVEGPIPAFIQRLTGIGPALLADAPRWENVALAMAGRLEGRWWVAHNASFDGAFLQAYLPASLWKRHTLLCTLRLARKLVPEASSHALGTLVEVLGLCNTRPHRALADAQAAAALLQVLIHRAEAAGWNGTRFIQEGRVAWR